MPLCKRKHLDNHLSALFRSVSQKLCWRTQPLISLKPQTIPQNPHSDSGRTSKDLHNAILLSSPVCLATLPYTADRDSGRWRSPLWRRYFGRNYSLKLFCFLDNDTLGGSGGRGSQLSVMCAGVCCVLLWFFVGC